MALRFLETKQLPFSESDRRTSTVPLAKINKLSPEDKVKAILVMDVPVTQPTTNVNF
ncbi:hypothetical protein O9992_00540 [Vibrio lentus]|nr:hypothetical protein [Vibrio lentus]